MGEPGVGVAGGYRRDRFTWAAFGALGAFGFLNAVLGPALPYLRAAEHIGYVLGALHQVAFAVGGGLAGLVATRAGDRPSRAVLIRAGLCGAAAAGVGIGYGSTVVLTVTAAFFVSLLGTTAMLRLWAALADAHGPRRTVAMAEGEVAVSLGGIIAPLLVGAFAATALTWRFTFLAGGAGVVAAVLAGAAVRIPPSPAGPAPKPRRTGRGWALRLRPTLVVVFAVVAFEFTLSFWLASYLDDAAGLPRRLAVPMAAGLYAANLAGRTAASALARRTTTRRLLTAALLTALAGLPILLTATAPVTAAIGLIIVGTGSGATFPLTSSLHLAATDHNADRALGQVFTTAAIGQVIGPLAAGAIAQSTDLRIGLLLLPALALLALTTLVTTHRRATRD